MSEAPVKIYSLSTCGNCRDTMNLLAQGGIEFTFIDVDTLEKDEKEKALAELKKVNPKCTFPTTVSGKGTIIGFDLRKLRKVFEIS